MKAKRNLITHGTTTVYFTIHNAKKTVLLSRYSLLKAVYYQYPEMYKLKGTLLDVSVQMKCNPGSL